jgi:hypothetical protein
VAPEGKPVVVKLTTPVNPPDGVIVTEKVVEVPATTVLEEGVAEIVKFAVARTHGALRHRAIKHLNTILRKNATPHLQLRHTKSVRFPRNGRSSLREHSATHSLSESLVSEIRAGRRSSGRSEKNRQCPAA